MHSVILTLSLVGIGQPIYKLFFNFPLKFNTIVFLAGTQLHQPLGML